MTKHFRLSNKALAHGIYIIRQAKTKEVLYIGKGGTLKANGEFKSQGIANRLKAQRRLQSSKQWLFDIYTERGPLLFQYIVLDQKLTPSLAEALLLQAFFNEHGRLPYKNNAL